MTLSAVAFIKKEYEEGRLLGKALAGEELATLIHVLSVPPTDQDFEKFLGLYKILKVRQLQTMIEAWDNFEERARNFSCGP